MRATILSPLKIIYPRAQNRIYIRRQLDLGASPQPVRRARKASAAAPHEPPRWSAGRRSVRAAGLANLSLRDARASGWASQTHPRRRAGLADRKAGPEGAVAQR